MNMKKIMALACMALALFTAGTSMADDNTGTGGTITYTDAGGLNPVASPPYAGGYVVHTFTNSDTLNIPVPASADVLVVGGGGGGGGNDSYGAGGGAGGLIYSTAFSIASNSSYTVTVGGGGAAAANRGVNGANSVFGSLTALGGGGGGYGGFSGGSGGSGGGGYNVAPGTGLQPGSSSGGYGYDGGAGPGGGGGGAGAAGGANYSFGGIGRQYSISGVATYYAGGGDGAGNNSVVLGGGGRPGGVANTGGGGAGGWNSAAGSGGSGIVIVKYPYALLGAPPTLVSIVDNKSGGPISNNTLVTYTVTFNKDMDASTVDADDFENADSAGVTIGTVTETTLTSGIFTVPVTPTNGGTLRLQIKASAVLNDADGTPLDATSALPDDTTITVDATAPTLAGSGIVDNKSGGPVERNTLVTYTVTFSEDMDASTVSAASFGNAGSADVSIGTVTETTPTSGVFTVPVTPTTIGTLQLQVNASAVLKDVVGNALYTTSAIPDDTTITVNDTIPPTLVSIVDNKSGGPIAPNTLVSYTVTFSEAMDAGTVDASDFGNAGGAAVTIGTVSQISPAVFSVEATPTSGGLLRLQVNQSAGLTDLASIALNTTSAILDNTTITVDATPPTLTSIVDNKSGGTVMTPALVTYTVTFSEDMDAGTVDASDFGNAGTAAVTIGTVTETTSTSGVFTVPVTATGAGPLQLKVNAGAVLNDAMGNALATTSAILDDTTITVVDPPGNTGSGGTITYTDSNGSNAVALTPYIGGYVVHTFTSSGTLNIPVPASADVLVVAGGGGGYDSYGGSGGAGGLIYSNAFSIAANSSYTVTVGGGGAGGNVGVNGANSVFGSLTALGGGGGAGGSSPGGSGGSGGGAQHGTPGTGLQPSSSSGGYGNNGGGNVGGGGGGAGGAGGNAYGPGGIGRQYSISGVATYYAVGGGWMSGNGVANTGGGGGAGTAGSGGSGIVIVKYPYTPPPPRGTVISFF